MTKLVWLSDTHFASGETRIFGLDPRRQLSAAVDYVNEHHSDAAYCVISGDLVNQGVLGEYRAFKSFLDTLNVPALLMVGNHDSRAPLRSVFSLPSTASDHFVQYTVDTDDGLIVCLDTLNEGRDSGLYCDERYRWLGASLERAAGRSAYVFMHHPPVPLNLSIQDTEILENGSQLLEFLGGFGCVAHLFIGHVHRAICGRLGGISFSTLPSTLYQAPPPRPEWDWDSFEPAPETPKLGIVYIEDGNVIVQYEQFYRGEF